MRADTTLTCDYAEKKINWTGTYLVDDKINWTGMYLVDESHGVDEQFCVSLCQNIHQILAQFHTYITHSFTPAHQSHTCRATHTRSTFEFENTRKE